MWMMLSSEYIQLKICRTFCQTPRNGFDFDDEIWFENGSQPLLITDKVIWSNHSGKDPEKNFKSVVAVSNLHRLEYIFVICKWPYLVIPMSSLVSYNKGPSQEHLMGYSDIISQPRSLTLWTLQVSHVRTFLSTREEQMSMFNVRYVQ